MDNDYEVVSEQEYQGQKIQEGVTACAKVVGALLGIVFLTVPMLAFWVIWTIIRRMRLKPSMGWVIQGGIILVTLIVLIATQWLSSTRLVLIALFNSQAYTQKTMMSLWNEYGISVVVGFIMLGIVLGGFIALWWQRVQIRKMLRKPYLTTMDNLYPRWMYHFEFRPTPWENHKVKRTEKLMREGAYVPYHNRDLLPLGFEVYQDNDSTPPINRTQGNVVSRAYDETFRHTIITGTTGSGKTVTEKSFTLNDMDNGQTLFFIDCKNDPENAEFLAKMAHERGLNFYHFADMPQYRIQNNPRGLSSYDPLASGNRDKKLAMLMGLREWDTASSVYRSQSTTYLTKVLKVMEECQRLHVFDSVESIDTTQGYTYTFVQLLDTRIYNDVVSGLNRVASTHPESAGVVELANALSEDLNPSNRHDSAKASRHAQAEYAGVLVGLMNSGYGKWLKRNPNSGSGEIINISELSSQPNNVVLFGLDASQPQDMGSVIGSLILNDITNMTEERKGKGDLNPVSVYVDEFQSLPPTAISSAIQKARSSQTAITLAFQSLEQITATTGRQEFIKGLVDTCGNFVFHNGSNMETGEIASKMLGTRKRTDYRVTDIQEPPFFDVFRPFTSLFTIIMWNFKVKDDKVTRIQTEEYILNPSEFTSLIAPNKAQGINISQAIVIKKSSSDPLDKHRKTVVAHKVSMIAPDVVLENYFDPNAPLIDMATAQDIRMSDEFIASVNESIAQDTVLPTAVDTFDQTHTHSPVTQAPAQTATPPDVAHTVTNTPQTTTSASRPLRRRTLRRTQTPQAVPPAVSPIESQSLHTHGAIRSDKPSAQEGFSFGSL